MNRARQSDKNIETSTFFQLKFRKAQDQKIHEQNLFTRQLSAKKVVIGMAGILATLFLVSNILVYTLHIGSLETNTETILHAV